MATIPSCDVVVSMAGWGLAIKPQHFLGLKDLHALWVSSCTQCIQHQKRSCTHATSIDCHHAAQTLHEQAMLQAKNQRSHVCMNSMLCSPRVFIFDSEPQSYTYPCKSLIANISLRFVKYYRLIAHISLTFVK